MPDRLLLLIGMNGSGKSSALQFFGFVQSFATNRVDAYIGNRGWALKDLRSKVPGTSNGIYAQLLFDDEIEGQIIWQFAWSFAGRNIRECVWQWPRDADSPRRIFDYRDKTLETIDEGGPVLRGVSIRSSVLSLIDAPVSGPFRLIKPLLEWASGITSLELLSPVAMRRVGRGDHSDLGPKGEHLASFLARLDSTAKRRVVARLAEFYPIDRIDTTKKRAGWIEMKVYENFEQLGFIEPDHVSDGFLRLLAMCAIPEFPDTVSLVLLDEVEDGIDPHILPDIIGMMIEESSAQFVMTSHSPLLVNFANRGDVIIVGRRSNGAVATAPFDELPSVKEGLSYFGEGELWAMLTKEKLADELSKVSDDSLASESTFSTPSKFTKEAAMNFVRG